jgi:hypothetical protein
MAAAEAEAWAEAEEARENDASHDNTITEFIRRSPVPVSPELKDVVCAAPFHSLAGRHCHWCQQRGPRAAACTHMRQSADAQRCRLQMECLLLSDALDKKVVEYGLQVRAPTPALARARLHSARGGGRHLYLRGLFFYTAGAVRALFLFFRILTSADADTHADGRTRRTPRSSPGNCASASASRTRQPAAMSEGAWPAMSARTCAWAMGFRGCGTSEYAQPSPPWLCSIQGQIPAAVRARPLFPQAD